MKKSILIATLLIIGLGLNSFAHTGKQDTVKKPPQTTVQAPAKVEYQPDPARVYHVTLDLTGPQVFGLTGGLDATLHRNPQLSGAQIGDFEDDNKSFSKIIKSQVDAQATADLKKWQADTTAKSKIRLDSLKGITKPKKANK